MKPIRFSCRARLSQMPLQIAAAILDLNQWPRFTGYGPLPGIRSAVFETRTADVVGTRIRVVNRDGSGHIEEIVAWEPERRLQLDLKEFTPPVSRLAVRFEEVWEFEAVADGTDVVRRFALYPRSWFSRPVLWVISLLLKRAIERHLRQMEADHRANVV